MIQIEHTEAVGWESAIRGMRNPLNSWDKSDSEWNGFGTADGFEVGPNDLSLMKKLVKAGSDHSKFMRMLVVYCDITAPLYWWKEYDTYKVGTVANSCSTMHTIHKRDLTVDDFSHEQLIPHAFKHLESTISEINGYRNVFVNWETQSRGIQEVFDFKRENAWYQIIQLLPTSYNQLRTVTLNYEVALKMIGARKAHKLGEWRWLVDVLRDMPYMKEFEGACNGSEEILGADRKN